MAHFAELDQNNIVLRVLVTDNNDPAGDEGLSWLVNNLGGTWVQTSYNSTIRKNFAGIGFTYDTNLDAFIPPKPFESWILNQETCLWDAPISKPTGNYVWDESVVNWVEVQGE
jgi:hypothetical protein